MEPIHLWGEKAAVPKVIRHSIFTDIGVVNILQLLTLRIHVTSHGENGSRPRRPLYPNNNVCYGAFYNPHFLSFAPPSAKRATVDLLSFCDLWQSTVQLKSI